MIRVAHPGPAMFAIVMVLTAILIAVGEMAGWSGEVVGTAFMGVIAIGVVARVLMDPTMRRYIKR